MLLLYSTTHVQLLKFYVDFFKKRHFIEKIHIKSDANQLTFKKQIKFVWNILRQNLISHLKNKDCQGAELDNYWNFSF